MIRDFIILTIDYKIKFLSHMLFWCFFLYLLLLSLVLFLPLINIFSFNSSTVGSLNNSRENNDNSWRQNKSDNKTFA